MNKKFFSLLGFLAVIGTAWAQIPPCPYKEYEVFKGDMVKEAELDYPAGDDDDDEEVVGYRNIFFIHGLGGDASAWAKVAEACEKKELNIPDFPARKCYTFRNDYNSSTTSLYLSARDLKRYIESGAEHNLNHHNVNPNTGILIAHSQGGVVCRQLMDLNFVTEQNEVSLLVGKGYGGLVTVASPLQGAMILNNKNLDKINDMADDACRSLSAGTTSGPVITAIINFMGINIQSICGTVSGDLFDIILSKYHDGITEAYSVPGIAGERPKNKPNSPGSLINQFNANATNPAYPDFIKMPKVAFFAIEPQNNIMWRTANWMVNKPIDATHFGANSDFDFVENKIYPLYFDTYCANYEKYKKKANDAKIAYDLTFWTGIGGIVAGNLWWSYMIQRDAWKKGVDWFDNANKQWESIIGARTYDEQTKKWITKPLNDGIVLAESAMNLPGATNDPVEIRPWDPLGRELIGSSHMQVRNDKGIKEHLNKLFNGDYGKFFQTEKK